MSTEYSAVTAKVKAMFGNYLTSQDYEALARMQTIGDIARYLKEKPAYKDLLIEIDDRTVRRAQLEVTVKMSVFEELERLLPYIPVNSQDFVFATLRRAEIEQIVNCIYFIQNKTSDDYILTVPTYLFKISKLDFRAMGTAKDYNQLLTVLKGSSYYKVLKSFNPEKEAVSLEFEAAIYYHYYKSLMAHVRTLPRDAQHDCLESVGSQVDFTNIVTIIRMKRHFNLPPETIEKMLMPKGLKITRQLLDKMVRCETESQVLTCLEESGYKRYFAEHADIGVDKYYWDYLYRISRIMLAYRPPSLNTVVSYINLKNVEINNIICIVESVRYGLPYNEIVSRIIGYETDKRKNADLN